jgi:hypothetical protein
VIQHQGSFTVNRNGHARKTIDTAANGPETSVNELLEGLRRLGKI